MIKALETTERLLYAAMGSRGPVGGGGVGSGSRGASSGSGSGSAVGSGAGSAGAGGSGGAGGGDAFDPERSRARFKEWFPELSPATVGHLVTYLGELNKFNKAVNLVSPQTLPVADAVHLADAVYAFKHVKPRLTSGATLYDFGSGNGIPGLVMGLLDSTLKVVLVDRDERKLEFCKHVAATCKAANVSTLKAEIEELPRHSVVNAVARGFAPLPKALLLTRNTVAKGGRFFHMKGDQFAQELSSMPSQLFSFWQPSLVGEYRLPDRGAEMSIVLTEKMTD